MKTSIILIRHGESLGNLDSSYYHLPDVANILSKKGVDQCIAAQKKIHDLMEDDYYRLHTTVISSVFQRAKITAQIVMHGYPMPILHDNRLNEAFHTMDHVALETQASCVKRMKSLLANYEYNLICFTHGLFMRHLDPDKGQVKNAEIRKYDRDDFVKMLDKVIV